MHQLIAELMDRYDQGQVNRRQLIAALAALSTARPTKAAASPFQGAGLNHIALRVADLGRSKRFYQDLLGLSVLSESSSSCFLKLGDEFLALFKGDAGAMDHYCIAIDNFQPDEVMKRLTKEGLKPRRPSGTDRIYFDDPDGLEVQFSAVDHRV